MNFIHDFVLYELIFQTPYLKIQNNNYPTLLLSVDDD